MEKSLLMVSCFFVLTEAHNISIDNINKSIIFHKTSIEQKIRCISDKKIKTKYTNELQNGKSLQISSLIALTKHGLTTDSTLDLLRINDTKSNTNKLNLQEYLPLIKANSIDELINIIGREKIKNWNTNEESDKNKLNTFLGFACATNARVNKTTFSQNDRHNVIDKIFIKIWDSAQTHLKTKIKRNLDIAFDSWAVNPVSLIFDYVLGYGVISLAGLFSKEILQYMMGYIFGYLHDKEGMDKEVHNALRHEILDVYGVDIKDEFLL